jgi:ABC-type polysaccharide/polyol phosphate transport system ATPase subunit
MSYETAIEFSNVWKKYSREQLLHNSLREEIMGVFNRRPGREQLTVGEFWALQGVDMKIFKGECVGLHGPNGSGKSTIFKIMSKVTNPTIGDVICRGSVAPLIELGAGFHPDLTGIENIYMNGTILGLTIRELKSLLPTIVEFSELRDFIRTPVKKYSSGMYLRLAFSIAVHSPADIFLFDEVLAVGDESFQQRCRERISQIRENGKTILIVSHNLTELKITCDKVFELKQGKLVSACT